MMLKRFLKPRWQHPDPDIRRQAIAELRWAEDAEAISQVSREDQLPTLRLLALRQCVDFDLVIERMQTDADPALRKEIVKHYRQMLAGLTANGPALADRLRRAAAVDDASLIEFLTREGADESLRAQALAKVERETVLRDVALKDASAALRLEALERIQDEAVLTRVYEQSRKHDKQISRRARERLEAAKAQRELPQRIAAQCVQMCTTLEAFGRDGHWGRDEARFDDLQQRWQTLEPRFRDEHEQRFAAAASRFRENLAASKAAGQSSRAEMQVLIARQREVDLTPVKGKDAMRARIDEQASLLRETTTAWKRIKRLPDSEEQDALDQQFQASTQALQTALEIQQRIDKLTALSKRFERLVARKGVVAENDVKALERERDAVPTELVSDELRKLQRRIDKYHQKIRDRLREQANWKAQTLSTLAARFDALKIAVDETQTAQAIALYDALDADLESLATIGASKERTATHRSRLRALAKDVQVMRAWGKFGATRVLESLCEQMEALKESKEPAPKIAGKIRAARDAWKEQSAKGQGAHQQLWKRFDSAATEAYAPCKAYFEERATERRNNQRRRHELLTELQTLVETAAKCPTDEWKKVVRARGELLGTWHRAHPVERKGAKALVEQFDKQLGELDAILGRERERSLRQREQLIADAEALSANPDAKATAEACKQLQRQWSTTVTGSRSQENELWKRFKGACDVIFAERQQVFDEERSRNREGIDARKALCAQVEGLIQVEAGGVDEAQLELSRIRREWAALERAPKGEANALESRFTAAVRGFDKHKRALSKKAQQAELEVMLSKATLCHQAEIRLNPLDETGDAHDVDVWRTRWLALPELRDESADTQLNERFEQALATRGAGTEQDDVEANRRGENLHTREALCLRLEILLGIDSPAEHAQARMALQVERLSSALKDRTDTASESSAELLRAWCLSGPVPNALAPALEQRFNKARLAIGDRPTQ